MQRLYERINTWCRKLLDVLGLRSQPIQLRRVTMPKVGKKKFSYTKAGMKKAKAYAKKTGKKMKKK